MWQKTPEELKTALCAPFANRDIEWRVSATAKSKDRGLAVPYVTNRAIQNRLDDTVGLDGWRNEFIPWKNGQAQLCGLSIKLGDGWLTKWDGADDSDIEPVKGGLSDSMKRAAVEWGIGRYLYGMTQVWVRIEERGKSFVIPDSERAVLDRTHEEWLAALHRKDAAPPVPQQGPPDGQRQREQQQTRQRQPRQAAPAPQPDPPQPAPASRQGQQGQPQIPDGCYLIQNAVSKPTVSGGSRLHLQLRDSAGQVFQAFLRGEADQRFMRGTVISDARFSTRTDKGVTFYILEACQFPENHNQAA